MSVEQARLKSGICSFFERIGPMVMKVVKSKFVRNVVVLASGTAGAQAIMMLFVPVITRLYGPEAYGILGTFTAITTIVAPVAALSYPMAIVLAKEDREARNLIQLSIWVAIAVAGCTWIMLFFLRDWILQFKGLRSLDPFLSMIPLAMLFTAILQAAQQWLLRKSLYLLSARAAVLKAIILNGAKVGIGLFFPSAAVLVVSAVIGNLLHAALLSVGMRRVSKEKNENSDFEKSETSFLYLAKTYSDFPSYRTPQIVVNAVSESLPVIILASFFGPAAAGFYSLGKTVIGIPSILVGRAIGDVFFPKVTANAHAGKNVSLLCMKATGVLALVGMFPFGLIFVAGPPLFELAFGDGWSTAGNYARWLSLWMYFKFMSNPCVMVLSVISAQRFYLMYSLCFVPLRFAAVIAAYFWFKSDLLVVVVFGVSGAVMYALFISLTLFKCEKFDKHLPS